MRIHNIDLKDREAVSTAVRDIQPEWVFYLAAYGAYSQQQGMEQMVSTNLLGCVALLDACAHAGVGVFVNAGSSSEYGLKDHAPSEDEPLNPNSHYAITKAAATHYCQFVARMGGPNAVTVRLYSVYGPYEDPGRLIPTLIVHGLGGRLPALVSPETARDSVFVDDAVDAMIRIASTAVPRDSIYNVCSGVQKDLREVVQVARRVMAIPEEPVWGTMPARSWDTNVWVGTARTAAGVGVVRVNVFRGRSGIDCGLVSRRFTPASVLHLVSRLKLFSRRMNLMV